MIRAWRSRSTHRSKNSVLVDTFGDFSHKKKHAASTYLDFISRLSLGSEIKLLRDLPGVIHAARSEENLLIIRHDIDHDLPTAVKFAKNEAANGWNSTYCVLHTSEYYRKAKNSRQALRLLSFALREIQDLGHEVAFHNNVISEAIRTLRKPEAILSEELTWLRNMGLEIVGSATHGDRLCREHGFRNWEVFSESCDMTFGGPRIIKLAPQAGKSSEIELGRISMKDFGLKYEAYDFKYNEYWSDVGGVNLQPKAWSGKSYMSQRQPENMRIVGVLTHPIWWQFE